MRTMYTLFAGLTLLGVLTATATAGLPGDANGDGTVSLEDFVALKTNFGLDSGATVSQGDFDGDGDVDLEDFVILKTNFGRSEPVSGRPILTVTEVPSDHYIVTAHDSADPETGYWEVLVDIDSGGIFSFKDLTDTGDGAGNHNSYLDVNAYNRKATLIRFAGRGGDVFSLADPVAGLANNLAFDIATNQSAFTITYTETSGSAGYYHPSYEDGDRSLAPGELLTTITLTITPPGHDGTYWNWSISYENVCDHDLSAKIWAVDNRELYLYGGLAKTAQEDTSRTEGPWDWDSPVSYVGWTAGDNSALGMAAGRRFILDCQQGLAGYTYGGTTTSGSWAGFDYIASKAGYALTADDALAPSETRLESGQVIIDIAGAGTSMLPIAAAGDDQTLNDNDNTGDEAVTFNGSASYDPDGTIVAYQWEQAGTVLATGVTPTITLATGIHTIDLIVTDDTGDVGADSVVITVNAYNNAAPTVEAGPNQRITRTDGVLLYGQAADDGLPLTGTLTTTWSTAGPGTVLFGDAGELNTIATFSADGVYILQLKADDGERLTIDTLTVTVDSTQPAPARSTSISQYGITWTFDHHYQTGQFANGDYWVVGPVTLTTINPPSAEQIGTTTLSGFTLGGPDPRPRTMNGSMLNPVTPPGGGTQGFDSDMYVFHPTLGRLYGPKFEATMNVALDVGPTNPLTLEPNSSLVSTISYPNGSRPQLQSAAVLTVLADVPDDNGTGFFRPPYSGPDKPLYSVASLRKDLLPNLPLVNYTPQMSSSISQLQRPWIDHFGHIGDGTQYSSPSDNMPNYGREYSLVIGPASLLLMLDEAELIATQGQNKDELLIRLVQIGIDNYHVAENGGYWWGLGGLNHGRKWPIIFAGLMLDNEHMRTIGSRSKDMPFWGFSEDGQTKYLDQSDVDMTHSSDWRPDTRASVYTPAEVEDIGLPEWCEGGFAPGLNPNRLNLYFNIPYRTINGMSYPGLVLPALIMGQRNAWNHDALFDYTDRYIPWATAEQAGTALYIYGGEFTKAMWEAYRADYPPVWSE